MFGEFDKHVVFQRFKIFKMTSKMAAITGWESHGFCYDALHRKISDSYFS